MGGRAVRPVLIGIICFLVALAVDPARAWDDTTRALSALPQIAEPILSPDGRFVALRQVLKGEYTVVIYDLQGEQEPFGWDVPLGNTILGYQWVADDRLLVEVVRPAFEFMTQGRMRGLFIGLRLRAHVIDPDGGNPVELYDARVSGRVAGSVTQIIDPLWDDPDHIIYTGVDVDRRAIYRGNIRREGNSERLLRGNPKTQRFLADQEGNVRLRIDAEGASMRVFVRSGRRGNWRRILTSRPLEETSFLPLAFDASGEAIYVLSNHEDRMGLYRVRLRETDDFERIYLHDRADLSAVYIDQETFEPVAAQYTESVQEFHYLDDEFAALNRRLSNSLPGPHVQIINSAAHANVHVVLTTGPSTPPDYYVLDEDAGTLQLLESALPQAADLDFGEVQSIQYPARDGTLIDGYLTFPPGYQNGPLPMVVMPHGGPHTRDTADFNSLTHLLASRGFVVFQMNFRGSSGYGLDFLRAGYREWGGLMQDDLTDGIDAMVERGVAQADQICIVGLSYGAYAAVLEALRTPERFQCVAGVAGAYDLPAMLERARNTPEQDYWEVTLGDSRWNRRGLDSVSPVNLVRADVPPILLAHGNLDYTVPVSQTEDLVEACAGVGLELTPQYYGRSTHQFQNQTERTDMYGDLLEFVDNHLVQ